MKPIGGFKYGNFSPEFYLIQKLISSITSNHSKLKPPQKKVIAQTNLRDRNSQLTQHVNKQPPVPFTLDARSHNTTALPAAVFPFNFAAKFWDIAISLLPILNPVDCRPHRRHRLKRW